MACARLSLPLLAARLANGEMNPCATAGDHLPDTMVTLPGASSEVACQAAMSNIADFTPDAGTCNEQITYDGLTMIRTKYLAAFTRTCCGGQPDVCNDFALNPCKFPGEYKPADTLSFFGTVSCYQASSSLADFVASAQTCAEQISLGGSMVSRDFAISLFSPTCCGGTANACTGFAMNPCKTPGHYTPGIMLELSNGTQISCQALIDPIAQFTASSLTCAKKIDLGGEKPRKTALEELGASTNCCGGQPGVCDEFALPVVVWSTTSTTTSDPGAGDKVVAASTRAAAGFVLLLGLGLCSI